jgi:hypothetical protein
MNTDRIRSVKSRDWSETERLGTHHHLDSKGTFVRQLAGDGQL